MKAYNENGLSLPAYDQPTKDGNGWDTSPFHSLAAHSFSWFSYFHLQGTRGMLTDHMKSHLEGYSMYLLTDPKMVYVLFHAPHPPR